MKLELQNASCGYGTTPVLSDVNLWVESGEVVCVLGQNGIGKSTVFKSMLGLIPLIKGRVLLDGVEKHHFSVAEFASSVGYVPQTHTSAFSFSVIDVVVMGRTANLGRFGAPTARDYTLAEEALERLGIAHLRDADFSRISGGERQMVLIARAIAQQATILLMDEPAANLDYANQIRFLEVVIELARDGLGVLMISHNPDHALLCQARTVAVTTDKRLITGMAQDILTETLLEQIYGIRIQVVALRTPMGNEAKTCVPLLTNCS